MNTIDLWKRKLAAYLHDPPEKAYDFGPAHHTSGESHAASFGVPGLWDEQSHDPDWSAAAADRFVFPRAGHEGVGSLGEERRTVFVHPMSGRTDGQPSWKADAFPSISDATQWLGDIRPDWKDDDPQVLFLKAWRLWMDHAASHATGQGHGAEILPYLPADTRVPDASIWHHCAIVSAIEGTRLGGGVKGPLRPAFLLFQVGPVQEFIAQARSTRDLWSGSYLLAWLMMHAIKALADECGPDALVFPSLRGQPTYEWLQRRIGLTPGQHAVLTPGIPNRFLALVPEDFNASQVEMAFRKEWQNIAHECAAWLEQGGIELESNSLWHEQIEQHWHITWQLWPWQSAAEALAAFRSLPLGKQNPVHLGEKVALAIPTEHRDDRCYRTGTLDAGWAWSAHYQLCQHALDARRNLRDFKALAFKPTRKPAQHDAFSGREEAVIEKGQLEKLAQHPNLGHLFRHSDPLGAANLVKRVWHKAYLASNQKLLRTTESFDSVPAVAAGAWLASLKLKLRSDADLWRELLALSERLAAARPHLRGIAIPDSISPSEKTGESGWLDRIDGETFTARFWQSVAPELRSVPEVQEASAAVAAFKKRHGLGEPPAYYAVLAMDGDQIGKWLSGELTPAVRDILAPRAVEYFEKTLPEWWGLHKGTDAAKSVGKSLVDAATHLKKPTGWGETWPPAKIESCLKAWLASPRPLSPAWHLQFSEALANFGLHAAGSIVEQIHHGQLIYAGGDDVLAMLPAECAITCARDLRAAFQGRRDDMSQEAQSLFRPGLPEGFLQLADPSDQEPTWPLLMPGQRMTVSGGLAIAHVKEPLQDVIQEAQRAEKRAKADPQRMSWNKERTTQEWTVNEGWGRDALAVTLFKRSGETIQWGAKFASSAFNVLSYLQKHYGTSWKQPGAARPIHNRFPYRVAALLGVYEADSSLTEELQVIAGKEIAHVISRQTANDAKDEASGDGFSRATLENLCDDYLRELCSFKWDRPGKEGNTEQGAPAARPLREFINLFLTEAFIRRQAD